MPGRKVPLVSGQIYHVLNRGVASQSLFLNHTHYQRGLETIFYYQNQNPPLRYSFFLKLSQKLRTELLDRLKAQNKFLVEILAYCLMPNHLHLLLKQLKDEGISTFMSQFANSYTRYFNTKQKRKGHLFESKFKAIRVETDEQLVHLVRYLHLNPYTAFVVKTLKELEKYPYSSFPEYLGRQDTGHCEKEIVLANFKDILSFRKFIFDQADYQRKLDEIKRLTLEV